MKTTDNTNIKFERLAKATSHPLLLENWYSETFPSDFTMDYHAHPQIEIMYCVRGQFDFMYKFDPKDQEFNSETIKQNCFIIVNTGYFHKIANLTPATKIINLEFLPCDTALLNESTSLLDRIFQFPLQKLFNSCIDLKKIIEQDRNYYVFTDNNNVLNTMKELIHKMKNTFPVAERDLQVALLTTNLFIDISHCVSPASHKRTGIKYIDVAMAYINKHFCQKITVPEISSVVGVSSAYLQKLFRIQYGKTVYDVITQKRIAYAKHLLEQSNLGIEEIAKQCGFTSREQFAYDFQKFEDGSPSKYRKKANLESIRFFSHYGETKA